jgi:ribosomal protein L11 methyltransferase
MPARLWPALDVQPVSPASLDLDEFQGLVLAALDERSVTAVQELPSGWRFFFNDAAARTEAVERLRGRWPDGLSITAADVSDEDWARRSQENLGAVQVGRIRLTPPWARTAARTAPSADDVEIVIQPSMGFGTGHHATTRLCTALLQRTGLAGRRVLDVGTGSGVLALVALRLGAAAVLGLDDDADALESARENLELNGVQDGIELRHADFRSLADLRFDVVTANLTGGLLIRGVTSIVSAVAPGGVLILSGITLEEETSVRAAFDPYASLEERVEEDSWIGLRYSRTA